MQAFRLALILVSAIVLAGVQAGGGNPPSAEGSFPGANGKIVFETSGPGNFGNIATVNPDGSGFRVLGPGAWPAWSPDGTEIAYVRSGNGGVAVMDAEGTFLRAISDGVFDGIPAWSPDGTRISFGRFDAASGIWIADADGSGSPSLLAGATASQHRWSPDGTKIVFADADRDLRVVSSSGGTATNITNTPDQREYHADWSPDGQRIVFDAGPATGGNTDIYVMNAAGGGRQRLTNTPDPGSVLPVWSPDGAKIVYTNNPPGSPTSMLRIIDATAPGGAAALNIPGTWADWQREPGLSVEFTQGIQQLQTLSDLQASLGGGSSASGATTAAAAPEQGTIGFVSWPDRNNIKVINTDGSGLRTVTSVASPGGFAGLDWSPDGTRLATAGGVGAGIKVIDVATGAVVPLTDGGDSSPSWSPDGHRIAFIRVSDPTTARANNVWVVDLASGAEQKLTGGEVFWEHSTSWSPDGDKILFSGTTMSDETTTPDEYDLFTVTVSNPTIHNLTNTPQDVEYDGDWSWVGANQIAYSRFTHGGTRYHVFVMNQDGSSPHEITHGDVSSFNLDWSPDGQQIAYSDASCTVHVVDATGANDLPLIGGCWPRWQPATPTEVEFTQAIQQLQTIPALQADLAGDGAPPVPIVAGKPAAMRVYFAEVEDTTHYVVQVSGVVSGSRQVTLDPGCTPTDRRRQDAGCSSVDFFFTPPEGPWSLTLDVRDFGGTTILNEVFHLTSVKTKPLNIVAVPVCDGGGCGLASDVAQAIGLLRATYPGTVNVSFASGGNVTRPTTTSDGNWWNAVLADLVAMRAADGVTGDVYYHGSVRTSAGGFTAATGGILGMGFRPGVAAATRLNVSVTDISGTSAPADQQVIAHEVGHNLGREHVPTVAGTTCYGTPDPNSLDAGWPHPNPLIAEVGFDVANAKAKRADQFTDIMAYCLPGWTSVYNYTSLMDSVTISPGPAAVAQGQAAGQFWEVSGSISGASAVLNPIFDVDTTGNTGAGSGSYRIEVRDGNGGLLFTRMFQPSESHWPGIAELESFFELIPAQTGAAGLAVFDPFNTMLVERDLTGSAPVVEFGDVVPSGDSINASWSVTDPDSITHAYRLEFSTDGGATWHVLIPHLDDPNVELDASTLPGSSQMQLRVQASDGAATSEATSETFAVPEHAPEAEIISPAGGTFRVGQLVPLLVAAFDADDGTLDGTAVSWSSSLDGALGNGVSLPVYDLSPGQHTITMTARDSDNNTATDSIALTIFDGPIVEAGAVSDIDCSGDVGAPDALALLFHLSGLDPGSCKTIGTGEPVAFGDANCDGLVGLPDVLAVLKVVAAIPSGCVSAVRLPEGDHQP